MIKAVGNQRKYGGGGGGGDSNGKNTTTTIALVNACKPVTQGGQGGYSDERKVKAVRGGEHNA
jgi:hypothetical protein